MIPSDSSPEHFIPHIALLHVYKLLFVLAMCMSTDWVSLYATITWHVVHHTRRLYDAHWREAFLTLFPHPPWPSTTATITSYLLRMMLPRYRPKVPHKHFVHRHLRIRHLWNRQLKFSWIHQRVQRGLIALGTEMATSEYEGTKFHMIMSWSMLLRLNPSSQTHFHRYRPKFLSTMWW